MIRKSAVPRQLVAVVAAIAAGGILSVAPSAYAAADADGDGIPNRWERNHGMNPRNAADARADFDKDGLRNLGEYRRGGLLRDEDTDDDGHDDGDEVHDGFGSTDLDDEDTNGNGTPDGDDDADHDGVDNEDEDDASEGCRFDDDDDDQDDVDDEDENEFGDPEDSDDDNDGIDDVDDSDSDGDNIEDGDEDSDSDGESDEDEDDSDTDACFPDEDGDGESDEDESDVFGVIDSFDGTTLVVTSLNGFTISGQVTDGTEIEFEEAGEDDSEGEEDQEATTADLQPGVQVAELEFDDETGALEEIEIYAAPAQP